MWPHLLMFSSMMILHLWAMPAMMLDSWADHQISLNQIYVATAMSLAMVVVEGFMHPLPSWGWFVALLGIGVCYKAARGQWWIGNKSWVRDMIPHHSMAVHTSKAILQKTSTLRSPHIKALATTILQAQTTEIERMRMIQAADGK
jgi:hypothetical protein